MKFENFMEDCGACPESPGDGNLTVEIHATVNGRNVVVAPTGVRFDYNEGKVIIEAEQEGQL